MDHRHRRRRPPAGRRSRRCGTHRLEGAQSRHDPRLELNRVRHDRGAGHRHTARDAGARCSVADLRLRRPAQSLCPSVPSAPSLHEDLGAQAPQPCRVSAGRGLREALSGEQRRQALRDRREDRQGRLGQAVQPLHRGRPDGGQRRHLSALHGREALRRAARQPRLHRRVRRAHRPRALALRGRRDRDVATPRRQAPLLRIVGQEDVRRRCGHPQGRLVVHDGR